MSAIRAATKDLLLRLGLYRPLWALRRGLASLDPGTARRNRRWRRAHRDELPAPPARLVAAVNNSRDIETFLRSGESGGAEIERVLAEAGVQLGACRRVLDFGCGCGRVFRHWHDRKGPEWHGTDYAAELVAWCRANLPHGRFATNGLAPPLAYPDRFFDLIYSISVFTHLDEELQDRWLAELRRVLEPGGTLLLTTHGDSFADGLGPAEQRRYREVGLLVRSSGAAGSNLCETYHAPDYFTRAAGRFFANVRHVPRGAPGRPAQDFWVLR